MTRCLIVVLLAWCTLLAHAGEADDRTAIGREFDAAFQRGDFAAIETRYNRAVAAKERLPSGVFVSSRFVYSMFGSLPKLPHEAAPKGNDAYWTPIEERARKWSAQYPKSTIAAITLANAYVRHGWEYRGGGYANTVAKEDWQKLKVYVGKAYEVLAGRAEVGRGDPTWRWQMLYVGRLHGWSDEKYQAFAQSALDDFPEFYDIYFEVAERLVPQWGGSVEAVNAFMDHAVERTKATEGRALYARIYWSVGSYLGSKALLDGTVKWSKVRGGFEDLVKRYPDPWNLNYFARMACNAGDKATTRHVIAAIGQNIDTAVWEERASWVRCRNWAES